MIKLLNEKKNDHDKLTSSKHHHLVKCEIEQIDKMDDNDSKYETCTERVSSFINNKLEDAQDSLQSLYTTKQIGEPETVKNQELIKQEQDDDIEEIKNEIDRHQTVDSFIFIVI